jgi:hypothetical protein
VLEKAGYQPVLVSVPTMEEDRCYVVRLSGADDRTASVVDPAVSDACWCQMFTGNTIWPEG